MNSQRNARIDQLTQQWMQGSRESVVTEILAHAHPAIVAAKILRKLCRQPFESEDADMFVRILEETTDNKPATGYARAFNCDPVCKCGECKTKITIGDIAVHMGMPPENNPYRGIHISGPERATALRAFKEEKDTSQYTFWHAPAGGGASQLTTPTKVDWSGLR